MPASNRFRVWTDCSSFSDLKSLPPTGQDCYHSAAVPVLETSSVPSMKYTCISSILTCLNVGLLTRYLSLCLHHAASHLQVVLKRKGQCFISGSPAWAHKTKHAVYEIEVTCSFDQCQVKANMPHFIHVLPLSALAELNPDTCLLVRSTFRHSVQLTTLTTLFKLINVS